MSSPPNDVVRASSQVTSGSAGHSKQPHVLTYPKVHRVARLACACTASESWRGQSKPGLAVPRCRRRTRSSRDLDPRRAHLLPNNSAETRTDPARPCHARCRHVRGGSVAPCERPPSPIELYVRRVRSQVSSTASLSLNLRAAWGRSRQYW